jgi:hypothetical protein
MIGRQIMHPDSCEVRETTCVCFNHAQECLNTLQAALILEGMDDSQSLKVSWGIGDEQTMGIANCLLDVSEHSREK